MDTELDYNTACNAYENKDYETAYELFYKLAMDSDVSCQVNVANMLMHGIGVEKSEERAFEWYEQAALNDDKEAQYIHAWHCLQNDNEKEGLKYLEASASSEFLDAVYDLAGVYALGFYSCDKDFVKASSLYEKAIVLGKREALGALFANKKNEIGSFKTYLYFIKNMAKFSKATAS